MTGDVIIRKQKIRITAPTEKLAFECRQFANETLSGDMVKMYEHLFFQSSQSDEYVIINSLKVDLGTLSTSDFKNHFFELLEEKLINELKNQFETTTDPSGFEEPFGNDQKSVEPSEPITYSTESQQEREALLIFLQNGNFPWWYQKTNRKTPTEILKNFTSNEQARFLIALITKAKSLPAESVKKIVKRLFIQLDGQAYETYLSELTNLFSEASLISNVKTVIEQKDDFLRLFDISSRDFYEQAVTLVLSNNEKTDFLKHFLVHLQQTFSVTTNQLHERENSDHLETFAKNLKSISANDQIKRLVDNKNYNKLELAKESLYISNAGIIILHPFLSTFFKGLNLLNEENQFASLETQTKAAILLHYLQCGMSEYREWEMPLNKILCGMATDEVIEDTVILSDFEKKESDELLQSIIEYWTALKGPSIEALQTTFFMREGKIIFKEDHWLIQVERTGVDILLDSLPWGIATIKLPWLEELIYVEW